MPAEKNLWMLDGVACDTGAERFRIAEIKGEPPLRCSGGVIFQRDLNRRRPRGGA